MSAVLIADDDEVARTLLREALTSAGYHTFEAADGDQAWRVIQTRPLAALVTDANLPGRSGLALLRGVRSEARLRAMPVVVVSGDEAARAAAVECGADGCLPKPFSIAAMGRAVDAAIQSRAAGAAPL